jgi:hypothetical protein
MTFDPLAILRTLVEARVEFIVIGGVAAAVRGSPSATVDLDICYRREEENLRRLASVLRGTRARLRGVTDAVPFLLHPETLGGGDHFTLSTDLGDLDLLRTPAGTNGYGDLLRDSTDVDLDGFTIKVASLDDLIRMKRAAGRPKDRVELEILGALRDEVKESEETYEGTVR